MTRWVSGNSTPPTEKTCAGNRKFAVSWVDCPHAMPAAPCNAMSTPMVATIFTTAPASRRRRNSTASRIHPAAGAITPTTRTRATTEGSFHVCV